MYESYELSEGMVLNKGKKKCANVFIAVAAAT